MRVPLVIKPSMIIGAVVAPVVCIGSGEYEGDPRVHFRHADDV
jgi:hypothetical protein